MNQPVDGVPAIDAALQPFQTWDGTTYYGRQQLKPWPFEPAVVGGYIFLAGLSGSAQILATVAQGTGRRDLGGAVRRGRYLALLAPRSARRCWSTTSIRPNAFTTCCGWPRPPRPCRSEPGS